MKITYFILGIALVLSSCNKEDNSSNFLGKQQIEVSFDGQDYTFFGGDYYESSEQANAQFYFMQLDDVKGDLYLKFTDADTGFDEFEIYYYSGNGPIPVGIVDHPRIFSIKIQPKGKNFKYIETIDATDEDFWNENNNNIDIAYSMVDLTLKDRYTNGKQIWLDGVQEEQPMEKIVGNLNFEFTDEEGENHTVVVDFNLEGDNLVDGGNEYHSTIPEPGSSSNSLSGKWMQVEGCSNANGDGNYFLFSSTTGTLFQTDCNNTCSGYGVTTKFNFNISGSNVTISPTSVSKYCDVQAPVPSSFTAPWSISGDILTLDGQKFKKQ